MPTSSKSSAARPRAAAPSSARCRSSTSVICVPIVRVGLSAVIGSWKTIPIWLPRTSSSSRSESVVSSRPSKRIEPETIRAGGVGSSRTIESAVTDLPQPDSPTMPSVRPASTLKLTPSTACTTPSRVKKCARRSVTSSSGMSGLPRAWVERVAEPVGDEVRTQDERRDRETRDDDDVRVRAVGVAAVLRHRSTARVGGIDAEPEEGQEGRAEDDAGQLEEDRDHEDAERVRQQVTPEDRVPAHPAR